MEQRCNKKEGADYMKNKKKFFIIAVTFLIIIIAGVLFYLKNNQILDSNKPSSSTADSIDMNINTDDGDEKIDWSNYQDKDYELTESITITDEGVYNLTGTISDGLIRVNTEGNVKLVLNNVFEITHTHFYPKVYMNTPSLVDYIGNILKLDFFEIVCSDGIPKQ